MNNKFISLPKRGNTPRFKYSTRFIWLSVAVFLLVFWIAAIVGFIHIYSLLMGA